MNKKNWKEELASSFAWDTYCKADPDAPRFYIVIADANHKRYRIFDRSEDAAQVLDDAALLWRTASEMQDAADADEEEPVLSRRIGSKEQYLSNTLERFRMDFLPRGMYEPEAIEELRESFPAETAGCDTKPQLFDKSLADVHRVILGTDRLTFNIEELTGQEKTSQARAKAKYKKDAYTLQITFYPGDDLADYIKGIDNKAGYIKGLIRQDRDNKKYMI